MSRVNNKTLIILVLCTICAVLGFAGSASAATYYASGYLYSTNIATGLSINSFDYFGYNVTIPANTTLKVQFSQDLSSWYSANHTVDVWSDLLTGNHLATVDALALSGFSAEYTFYYRILLETTDTAATPVIEEIQLWYNLGSYGTASTQAVSSNAGITATGNGTIVSEGNSDVTKRGFQYGLSATSYSEVSESGSYNTGTYSLTLTSLYQGAYYYVRAFIENSQGRAYGDWVNFTANDYYNSSGVVYSINLLSGLTVNSIDSFYTSATIPAGTSATMQFSQNNSAWYSALGVLDGTTAVSDGVATTSLSALGWSGANFYYKITINANTARDATPSLDQIIVNYNVPSIGSGPSDAGSSTTTPTLAGSNVTFTTTATDPESDNYYLAICKTDAITAVNSAVPTCDGGNWCVSGSTVSASEATCNYATSNSDGGSHVWYAFVCDHNADSACSVSSQGTGDNGSPFVVSSLFYWVAGTGNWSDATNHWATSSGGSPNVANVPDANSNVYFNSSSGTGTVTIDTGNVSVVDLVESSTNITIATSTNGITVTGNSTINKTISGATAITFSGSGKTITGGSGGAISAPVVLGATQIVAVATGTFTISGIISDGGLAYGINKTGANTLTLSGANTFTGGLTIKAGTVFGRNTANSFGADSSVITIGDTSGSANAKLETYNWSGSFANPITVASGSSGMLSIQDDYSSCNFTGAITLNNNLTLTNLNTNNPTFSGGITGTGNITINNSGTGTTTISTASVNHTGTITNSGSGTGTTTISAVIGTNVTGVIQNSATSQLTLSGANTFTGGLTIKAGTVRGQTNANAFGANSSIITIGDTSGSADATLVVNNNNTYPNPITVASGSNGTLSITTISGGVYPAFSGAISLSNNLTVGTFNSAAELTFTGGVSGSGNLIINTNSSNVPGYGTTFSTTSVNMTGTITNSGTGTGTTTISAVIGTNVTGVIQNSATSQLKLSGANTFTGGLTIKSGTVLGQTSVQAFGDVTGGGTNGTITLGDGTVNASVVLSGGTTQTYANPITVASISSGTATIQRGANSPTFSGAIALSDDVVFAGAAGTLTISGAISGTGNISVTPTTTGAVTISNASINPTGTITNNGTSSGTTTISGVIGSNVTGITQNSATSGLILSGNNSTAGSVTISAGALALSGTTNLNVSGGWTNSVGAAGFTYNTSTVTLTTGTHAITGANTFYNLTLNANNAVTFPASTTQTIGNTFSCTGTAGNLITIDSSTPATQATLSKASGTVDCDYMSITDSEATGGATWNAGSNSTGSNYTGWLGLNTAPTLTNVADSPDPIKGGSTITIAPTGHGDGESDALYYYCNESGTATSANTLCSEANASYASPYSSMTCTYNVTTGDTTRTVYCRAYDAVDYSTERTTTYLVDTTAPSGGSVSYTDGYFTTASVPVTYTTGTDSGSGLNNSTGKIQRATATLTNGSCGSFGSFSDLVTEYDGSYTDTTVASANCYMYQYVISDNVVNTATYTSANVAKVDTSVPTTSDDFAYDDTWQAGNQTITLTPADSGGSGIAWTKYCADTDNTCDPSAGTAYTVPVVISTENTSYFRYASQDNAGNTQTTVSKIVKIDKTAPSTVADAGSYTFGTWSASNVTVTLTCADGAGSGCVNPFYCADTSNTCTPTTTYTAPVVVSTGGTSYIRYYSIDFVTNSETVASQMIKINSAPTIGAGPSDSSSSATTPTNVGSNVSFTATATDSQSDNYYLAICKTDVITAVNNGAPTCDEGNWCISSSTTAASEATCNYTTLTGDSESNVWYAFVCDYHASSLCSSSSQGTGDNGSPFKVNHIPVFTAISTSPDSAGLGSSITFSSTASDADTDTSADTVTLYVCKSNDFTGIVCGSGGEWCHSSASASDPSCSYTVLSTDTSGTKTYYGYIIDSHNFQSSSNPRSSTFDTDIDTSVISDISPTQGMISGLPSSVSFTLDEIGYCRSSSSDLSYSAMTSSNDCSGGGTTSITCSVSSASPHNLTAHISCQDILGNENSASNNTNVFYHLPGGAPAGTVSFNPIIETVQKTVEKVVEQIAEIPQVVVEQVKKVIDALKPAPKEKQIAFPPIEETVTEETPSIFKYPEKVFSPSDLGNFVLAPLPKSIQSLIAKFPELKNTFKELSITRITDLQKMRTASFNLPTLNKLLTEKQSIPTDIVFASMSEEKIGLNVKVSITDQGEPIQTINIIQNKIITLSVKPEYEPETVKGYVIFKGRNSPVAFAAGLSALLTQPQKTEFVLDIFDYTDPDKDGIYTARIVAPAVDANYEVRTIINYKNSSISSKEFSMIMVVDPEGYIYRKINDSEESRIKGAEVSIYWLNPQAQYELWPAKDFQQNNPQTTDTTGNYSFLVPEGSYYLKVEHILYADWKSKPFEAQQGTGIYMNIELKPKNWLVLIFSPGALLIAIVLLLMSAVILVSAILITSSIQQKK